VGSIYSLGAIISLMSLALATHKAASAGENIMKTKTLDVLRALSLLYFVIAWPACTYLGTLLLQSIGL